MLKVFSVFFVVFISTNAIAKSGGVYLEPSITYTSINLEAPTSSPGVRAIQEHKGEGVELVLGYSARIYYTGFYGGYSPELSIDTTFESSDGSTFKLETTNTTRSTYGGYLLGFKLGKYARIGAFYDLTNDLEAFDKDGNSVSEGDTGYDRYGISLGLRLGSLSYLNITYGVMEKKEVDTDDYKMYSASASISFPFGFN